MRQPLDKPRLQSVLRALGRSARGDGRVLLSGGATALLEGWRASTVDVDLCLDEEPAGLFEAIARVKRELDVSIELAGPADFVPPLAGRSLRQVPIGTYGRVAFAHEDPYLQAFAKLSRGHRRDMGDVAAMVRAGWVEPDLLLRLVREARPAMLRYPALDPDRLVGTIEAWCEAQPARDGRLSGGDDV